VLDDHVMTIAVKCAGKNGSDLSRSPGMTIFILPSALLDEAISEFRRRHQAQFAAAENAIPGSSDHVVQSVAERRR
jgi:hypothetical protein